MPRKRGTHNIDLTGQTYNFLRVIRRVPGPDYLREPTYECVCTRCGTTKNIRSNQIRKGIVKSCSCYNGPAQTTHGMSRTREYATWRGMKGRCLNKNDISYPHYGGRGITICPEWIESFEAFYQDMGPKPPGTSIDRINNDLGYYRDNCRYTTVKKQNRNRRKVRQITFRGKTQSAVEWAEEMGLTAVAIIRRLDRGWPVDRALTWSIDEKKRNKK